MRPPSCCSGERVERLEALQPAGSVIEELTRPREALPELLKSFDGPMPCRQRALLPTDSIELGAAFAVIGAEIDGEQPFETRGENIGEYETESVLDEVIKAKHDEQYCHRPFDRDVWLQRFARGRVKLDGQIATPDAEMTAGQTLHFIGDSDGDVLGVLAQHAHGDSAEASRKETAQKLVKFMEPQEEKLVDLVEWDRLPVTVTTWAKLMEHLCESCRYLADTGADYLLLVAAAHVLGPVLVFHVQSARAVRFVVADRIPREGDRRGYAHASQLPAGGKGWIRIGLLKGRHFVHCRSKALQCEELLMMCDARDKELEALNVDVPHAVLFVGPSKTGKSTIMNVLKKKVIYDATPQANMARGVRFPEPALAVLGDPVRGSTIGKGKTSETLIVNSVVVDTGDRDVPQLQLLDTPGQFDSRGPLVEVVNAISISKCMQRFRTLRYVVMTRESSLDGTAEAFASTALTMQQLFSRAEGGSQAAAHSIALWVNPHNALAKFPEEKGVMDVIGKIRGARPEIREFLNMLIQQQKSRRVVQVLEYTPEEATGGERTEIIAERNRLALDRGEEPENAAETKATKAIFPVAALLDSLLSLRAMQDPAGRVGLPLTEKAQAEIHRQESQLHDAVLLRCELHDYASLDRYLSSALALRHHMSTSELNSRSSLESAYRKATAAAAEHVKKSCGAGRIDELCNQLMQTTASEPRLLDALSFLLRVAASAESLNAHFTETGVAAVNMNSSTEAVCKHLTKLQNECTQLLVDHFSSGSSGMRAADSVFCQHLKRALMKFRDLHLYFLDEVSIQNDGCAASFSRIAKHAEQSFASLQTAIISTLEKLTSRAVGHIDSAWQSSECTAIAKAAADVAPASVDDASAPLRSGSQERFDATPSVALWNQSVASMKDFDNAAEQLEIVQLAATELVSLVPELANEYGRAQIAVFQKIEKQANELQTMLDKKEDAGHGSMMAKLLFLLLARSSPALKMHMNRDEHNLDVCYERPIGQIVRWHKSLVNDVESASKQELFAERVSDFKPEVELAMKLAKLGDVELLPSGAIARSTQWSSVRLFTSELTKQISIALTSYTTAATEKMQHHAAHGNAEAYEYTEHAKDLQVLVRAAWCDSILMDGLIKRSILKMWKAFEDFMNEVSEGENGAIGCLKGNKYTRARSLLLQVHSMETLWKPQGTGESSVLAEGSCGAQIARRVAKRHDKICNDVNDFLKESCTRVRANVLPPPPPPHVLEQPQQPPPQQQQQQQQHVVKERKKESKKEKKEQPPPLPPQHVLDQPPQLPPPPPQRSCANWIDASVGDAYFKDALAHLDKLLELADAMLGSGSAKLSSWLDLSDLKSVSLECKNRAVDTLDKVRGGVQLAFTALGACDVRKLNLFLSGDSNSNAAPNEAIVQKACAEIIAILRFLSRPTAYPAVFKATRDDDSGTDDLAAFRELGHKYQAAYHNSARAFSNSGTEPAARQIALNFYDVLGTLIPSESVFEPFRAIYAHSHQWLFNYHQERWNASNLWLGNEFGNHNFTDKTNKAMSDLRDSSIADPTASLATYKDACSSLTTHVWFALDAVQQAFVLMQHPDQSSFSTQEHLVKPWNQLVAARSHACFLKDAPSDVPCDLEKELDQRMKSFAEVFKERLMKPLVRLFDAGEYTAAEGGARAGFQWLAVLVMQLQPAHATAAGSLGKLAQDLLDAERTRQRDFLDQAVPLPRKLELPPGLRVGDCVLRRGELHAVVAIDRSLSPIAYTVQNETTGAVVETELSFLSFRPEIGELVEAPGHSSGVVHAECVTLEERMRKVDDYIEDACRRAKMMVACEQFTELGTNYKKASVAIIKEVQTVVCSELKLLEYQDESYDRFLSVPRDIIEYMERLLKRMSISVYHEMLQQRMHFEFEKWQAAIGIWRSTHTDHIDPKSFGQLSVAEQFERIKRTDTHNPRRIEMVRDFVSAYDTAVRTAEQGLTSFSHAPSHVDGHTSKAASSSVAQAVEEARERAKLAPLLAGATIEKEKLDKLELLGEKLQRERSMLEALLDSPTGCLRGTPLPDASSQAQWDQYLKSKLNIYLQLVKLAPRQACDATAERILNAIVEKLQLTVQECLADPASKQEVKLKSEALRRLLTWESCDAAAATGSSAELSLLDSVAQLEDALKQHGVLSAPSQLPKLKEQATTHMVRVGHISQQIHAQVLKVMASLGLYATFDPLIDRPLEPEPFEVIFSPEMAVLINRVDRESLVHVNQVKTEVERLAQANLDELQRNLDEKQYKAANIVLQRWKFLEPLSKLSVFERMPGQTESDTKLKSECDKLASASRVALSVHKKSATVDLMVPSSIIKLAKFGSEIPRANRFTNPCLNDILHEAEAKLGISGMQSLASELRRLDPTLGNEIVSTSDAFQTLIITEFNIKTKRDIEEVKRLFAERNVACEKKKEGCVTCVEHVKDAAVWKKYDDFKSKYDDYLHRCVNGLIEKPLDWLVQEAKELVQKDAVIATGSKNFRKALKHVPFGSTVASAVQYNLADSQEQIPHVLATIFAWWTMDFYLTLKKRNPDMDTDTAKLRHANNGQVVCLLRLLGATGGSFVELVNHLAEVPTGEGKSVILGVLATTLALYGYHVDCVCYSSMLSSRDQIDFAPMFIAFGIAPLVRYGTFDTLSEDLITEQYGDLRQAARDYIAGASSGTKGGQNARARVLVIDEVDVFCSEAFFGGAYCPQLELKDPPPPEPSAPPAPSDQIANPIAKLMRHIWSIRSAKLDLTSLKGHPAYTDVVSSGLLTKQAEWLLERSVQQMHIAAKTFVPNMREFKIEDGCILYKLEGRDEYARWSYGYETNAEYLHAHANGKLSDAQLVASLALHVRCGEFAFAKLPHAFKHILGVTGTLEQSKLPPQMLEVLKAEVKIKEFTYCPSMYHAQKRDFEPSNRAYVRLAKDDHEHFNLIADEIDLRLKPTGNMVGARSVIVFFRDEKELQRFRSSSYFNKHRSTAQVLTELTAARREDRDSIVNKATRQGMVTLASRMYGRGTDFKIFDDRMEACGGLHVLQTFFSADLSEEVQIQGRCARQGNQGSYSLVLHVSSLAQQFDEKDETINGWPADSAYANLVKLREARTTGEVQSLRALAAKRKGEHGILEGALQASLGGDAGAMEKVMRRYNTATGLVIAGNGLHIIFCLDESGSMEDAPWKELVGAFNRFWQTRVAAQDTITPDHASVIQFSNKARVTHEMREVTGPAPSIKFGGGGTAFLPPITEVQKLVKKSGPDQGYTVVVVFMSDGAASDAAGAAGALEKLAQAYPTQFASYTVGFGSGASQTLQSMAFANGVQENSNYRTADIGSLGEVFAKVAASIVPGRVH
jgi:uncharacterized protein YegL